MFIQHRLYLEDECRSADRWISLKLKMASIYCVLLRSGLGILVLAGMFHLAQSYEEVTGVVGSQAVLHCFPNASSHDIEAVHWRSSIPGQLSVVFFIKEDRMDPANHDPRMRISRDTHLYISSLEKADQGTYICTISSHEVVPTYVVNLIVPGVVSEPIIISISVNNTSSNSRIWMIYLCVRL